ncbi:MAG TPA: Asp-tRNA(Asn)/Glu-tRNA(Gln) amidotransferase GatCAB subunit B, partial [Anaerolineales bacterium]|nr:Asp-tRNA(Asn)/Glu-tRNA(Gln) amidotransferase GatCAB subunit B [Anaerolineales bacterium]
SGDLQKGVLRIEPNVSVRLAGSPALGTRTEIKNLNSFRALERSVAYEIARQSECLRQGQRVIQQTLGWDDLREVTVPQRSKEDADDYRYFPEPDLPPLVIDPLTIEQVRAELPELPLAKYQRFLTQYALNDYDAGLLVAEQEVAAYYEQAVKSTSGINPKAVANWITGELFSLLNLAGLRIASAPAPAELAALVAMVGRGELNQNAAKTVLAEMFQSREPAASVSARLGLSQISDPQALAGLVREVLANYPEQVQEFRLGKAGLGRWLFGQVMRAAQGRANPQVLQAELDCQLQA